MKPLKLRIKAFGPYANEVTINFEDIRDNLFLISGDTGAGKTTIFDAMCYALYGVTTGDKKANQSRNTNADSKVKTEVEFTFSHNGGEYTVLRSMRLAKHSDGTNEVKSDACAFTGTDILPISKGGDITKKITELIGYDANQFKQVILLQQGDFKKFLDADSAEKQQILGKLFGTDEYVAFESRLKAAKEKLEKNIKDDISAVNNLLNPKTFRLPDDMSDAERLIYRLLPDCSNAEELTNALDTLTKSDSEALKLADEKYKGLENELNAANKLLTTAKHENEELLNLQKEREKKLLLESREDEFESREKNLNSVERAYLRVYPIYRDVKNGALNLERLKDERKRLKETLAELDGKLSAAKTEADKNPVYREEINRNSVELSELKKAADVFETLQKDENTLSSKLNAQSKRKTEYESLEKSISLKRNKLEETENSLRKYDGIDERLNNAVEKYDAQREKYRKLDAVKKNGLKAVSDKKKELEEESLNHAECLREKSRCSAKYLEMYERFIDGQAGFIAEELKNELLTSGETKCKVCGKKLISADIPSLKVSDSVVPTKSELDEAAKISKEADEKAANSEKVIEKLRTELEAVKQNILRVVADVVGESCDFDGVSEFIDLKLNEITDEGKKAAAYKKSLEADKAERDNLRKAQSDIKENLPSDENALKETKKKLDLVNSEINSLTARIELNKKAVEKFGEKSETDKKTTYLEEKNKILDALIKENDKNYNDIITSRSKLSGSLSTTENDIQSEENNYYEKSLLYAAALVDNAFANEDEFKATIRPLIEESRNSGRNPDAIISDERNSINDYKNSLKVSRERTKELSEKTKDFERRDEFELQAKIDEITQRKDASLSERDDLNSLYDIHLHTAREVKKKIKRSEKYMSAFNRVAYLSDVANGNVSGEQRLSFDTYVIGQDFKLILAEANKRLTLLSDGRYELLHRVEGGKQGKTGLDIDVYDNFGGKTRSAKTLSGGEGFLVSLSLALGLSDVVRSKANGNKIDAMFIDEGFGTLDDDRLDATVFILKKLSDGNQMVGIISHVDKLECSISSKILVKSKNGVSNIDIIN